MAFKCLDGCKGQLNLKKCHVGEKCWEYVPLVGGADCPEVADNRRPGGDDCLEVANSRRLGGADCLKEANSRRQGWPES